jgi:hypothetical protein
VGQHLTWLLPQLDFLRKNMGCQSFTAIVEDHSVDQTETLLKKWQASQSTPKHEILVITDFPNSDPSRPKRIAKARNRILKVFKEKGMCRVKDGLMIMLDMDGELAGRLPSPSELKKAIKDAPKNWMGLTAVTPMYYDSWALRSPWCTKDWVHECTRGEAEALKRKVRVKYAQNLSPIPVESAFNGFGIYRASAVCRSNTCYSGWDEKHSREICEHVPFSRSLNQAFPYLQIYLVPSLRLGTKDTWEKSRAPPFPKSLEKRAGVVVDTAVVDTVQKKKSRRILVWVLIGSSVALLVAVILILSLLKPYKNV